MSIDSRNTSDNRLMSILFAIGKELLEIRSVVAAAVVMECSLMLIRCCMRQRETTIGEDV